LLKVPGIGPLGASALRAELGDGSAYKNSREFACCRGLAPSHTGTGGKVRMGGISKRADPYVRTLLIHGARNLVRTSAPAPWIAQMLLRRPFNVVAVAVAHKLARIAWSIVVRGEQFDLERAFGSRQAPA
jgi:transposase